MEPSTLDRKIEALIDFLHAAQLPDGEFPTLRHFPHGVGNYVKPTKYPDWWDFGSCPFATANVVYQLTEAGVDDPKVTRIRARGCQSLAAGFENGVARYVPGHTKPPDFPTDVDDTCLAAAALKRSGWPVECNTAMVLDNGDGRGNFFTWLIPRPGHARHPENLRWLENDYNEINARTRSYGLPQERLDHMEREYRLASEPGITPNVLLYTGVNDETRHYLDTLIARVRRDDLPPGYYASRLAAYFHIARLYGAGVRDLEVVRDVITGYIVARQAASGEVETPFNTALSALTLHYFNCWGDAAFTRMVRYIAAHPMHDRGWLPLHYCNDLDGVFVDGGAELTAAFFLHLLIEYRRRLGS